MVIFFSLLALGLAVVVILLSNTLTRASGATTETTGSNSTASNFDQATIDRINSLKTSTDPSTPLDFSKGRVNPFSEE